ncbi:serine/threonine-protein kinase [Microbacterium sp. DT81.1]|uniref:serine/threonine-protein kinase n=1 Tax=Microbacterium sp. DT81.1 TaxID=3393413 RepID=UPI003CFBB9A0
MQVFAPLEDEMAQAEASATFAMLDGRYRLHECVGQGATAKVYRADDLARERTVAIKMLRDDSDTGTGLAEARNEVALLASLDHPALVTLLNANLTPGEPGYLVMEFVDGPTLAHQLLNGPLDMRDVAYLACDLASALHAVHEAGIVHRDVKPLNILLTHTDMPGRSYHAKLADFGVASMMDGGSAQSHGVAVGTTAYLAPEQVRDEDIGPSADIYALGLVLVEAMTGQRAFPEAAGIGAAIARLLEPPRIPEQLPRGWSRLLRRMTAPDPTDRPAARTVAQRAFALMRSGPAMQPVPGISRRPGTVGTWAPGADARSA